MDGTDPTGQLAAPDEAAGPDSRVTEVKAFFNQLKKGMKNIGLHRHAAQQYSEFLQPAYELLTAFLDQSQNLTLSVEQTSLKYADEVIYEEDATDQNLAFKFFRDRVRLLVFHKELTAQELLDFVLISLTHFRPGDPFQEDLVSLMWKKEFQHIDYVRVESYALGDATDDQTEIEVDKVIAYLYQRLTTVSQDTFQFARLSLDDLDLVVENVHKAFDVKIEGETAGERDRARILHEAELDDKERLMPRLVEILLAAFQEEFSPELGQVIEDGFVQLFDSFLLLENFDGIDSIFRRFRGLEPGSLPPENARLAQRVFNRLVQKMGEDETVEKMAEILEMSADKQVYDRIRQYLIHLRTNATQPILRAIERINRKEAREVLCDALIAHGKNELDVFVSRLQSKKANLVRDMLYVLDQIDPPDKLKYVAGLLSHPNLAIRMEALKSIGQSASKEVVGYLTKALEDKDAQVRMTAARILPDRDKLFARAQLMPIVQKPEFRDRADREQVSFFTALAMTDTREAFDFLSQQIQQTGILGRKRLAEMKKNVITGVANAGTEMAYLFLKQLMQSGLRDKDLQATAERAIKRVEDKLKQDKAEAERGDGQG